MERVYRAEEIKTGGYKRWTVTKGYLPYWPIESFLKHKWENPRNDGDGENTTKAYSRNLAEFANYLYMEGYEWWDVSPTLVSSYVEWLKRGGPQLGNVRHLDPNSRHKAAYAPATINQRTTTILSCFTYHKGHGEFAGIDLKTWRYVPPNGDGYKPEYEGIKHKRSSVVHSNPYKQKVIKKVPPTLEPDEVEFLIDSCNMLRDKLLVSVLYDMGGRIGEVLGMRHEDFHPQECTVDVVSRINANGARVKNSAERFSLKVSERTMSLFTEYLLSEYPEEFDSDYVFVVLCGETRGNPLQYGTARKMLLRLRKKLKEEYSVDKDFTAHWLRHTFGTDSMQEDGTGGRATQETLGHAQFQTSQKYNHPSKEKIKENMQEVQKNREERVKKRREGKGK